jgi:hypothetical protein
MSIAMNPISPRSPLLSLNSKFASTATTRSPLAGSNTPGKCQSRAPFLPVSYVCVVMSLRGLRRHGSHRLSSLGLMVVETVGVCDCG